MPSSDANRNFGGSGGPWFATTHWSVVLSAADAAAPGAQEALEKLCRVYWHPLYSYVRLLGHNAEDAQDLTQAFFARFLEKNIVQLARQERGKFRSFLLTSLKNFLANEWERARTSKRGGQHVHLSWDQTSAENQFEREHSSGSSPEEIFDRRWALALFQQALTRLRQEYASAGKGEQFEQLKGFLSDAPEDGGY